MNKLLLISLGKLTGAVLEAVARDGRFPHIIVATRNVEAARAKANAVRIGAALEGLYPRIDVVGFDFNAPDAAEALRKIQPDLMFAAPTMLPWWKLDDARAAKVKAMPFAGWLACHLAPMLSLRAAWEKSGLRCPWVGASYPDVVNAILHLTGAGPTVGVGNVAECIPKVRLLAAKHTGAAPTEFEVKLVAQHALEYFLYSDAAHREQPPFLLQVLWHKQDISLAVKDKLRSVKMPIPYDLDFNRITASSALDVLAALLGEEFVALHAPAPNGLVGGYPVKVGRKGVFVDLPPAWDMEHAIGTNAASLAWDGIAALDKDGTVIFTESCAAALKALLGETVDKLHPDQAAGMAQRLIAAFQGGGG